MSSSLHYRSASLREARPNLRSLRTHRIVGDGQDDVGDEDARSVASDDRKLYDHRRRSVHASTQNVFNSRKSEQDVFGQDVGANSLRRRASVQHPAAQQHHRQSSSTSSTATVYSRHGRVRDSVNEVEEQDPSLLRKRERYNSSEFSSPEQSYSAEPNSHALSQNNSNYLSTRSNYNPRTSRTLQRSPLGPGSTSYASTRYGPGAYEDRRDLNDTRHSADLNRKYSQAIDEDVLEEFPSLPGQQQPDVRSNTLDRRRVRLLVDEDDPHTQKLLHSGRHDGNYHPGDSSGEFGTDPEILDVLASIDVNGSSRTARHLTDQVAKVMSSSPPINTDRELPSLSALARGNPSSILRTGQVPTRPRSGTGLTVDTVKTFQTDATISHEPAGVVVPRPNQSAYGSGHHRRQTWTGRDLHIGNDLNSHTNVINRPASPARNSPYSPSYPTGPISAGPRSSSWLQQRPGIRDAYTMGTGSGGSGPASPTGRRFSSTESHTPSPPPPPSSATVGPGSSNSTSIGNAGRTDEYGAPALQGEVTHAQRLLQRAAADFLKQPWLDGPLQYSPYDYALPGTQQTMEFRAPELRDLVKDVSQAAVNVDRGLRALSEGRARLGGVAQLSLERDVERLWRDSGEVVRGLTEILLMISEHGVPGPAWRPNQRRPSTDPNER